MEQVTSLVSSRGILHSCSLHNRAPVSSCADIDADLLDGHFHGASVYVCTDALVNFAENFLPRVKHPFVLVSGDSDMEVSSHFLSQPSIARLLESELLLRWFAQNLSGAHPKLRALPIGIDYHTMASRAQFWSLSTASPLSQEHALLDTLASSPPFWERYLVGYCSWQFGMSADRVNCMERIDKAACFFERAPVPRHSTWQRQAQCMFVVSPEGVGMDCHRTWEALALGCVPVVKRNAVCGLLEGLPALILDDWAEVSRASFTAFLDQQRSQRYDFRPLFKDFWMRRIRGERDFEMPLMNFAEFRHFLKRGIA